jgi:CRISPR-associated exonuclease Cas4
VGAFINEGVTTPWWMSETVAFSDLRLAAYCPRKLYYARREDDRGAPPETLERRELAFQYPELLDASDESLARRPLAVSPREFRANLERSREHEAWDDLADPPAREELLEGRDCRGIAHKVLEGPPRPSVVSAGEPPEQGVWKPQSVHAVAAAKALAYEREQSVERAYVEYPAYGVVRTVRTTTHRKAAYRTALEAARSVDGPPPRLQDDAKCDSCEYREECGVRTRTLRSLLG